MLFQAGAASADWGLQIANDGMDESWELWILTDETLTVNGYSLEFEYDYEVDKLTWNSDDYQHTPPEGLSVLFGGPSESTNGRIGNFVAGGFGAGASAQITGDTQIGSFTLNYTNRNPEIGDFNWWNTDNPDFTIRIDGTVYEGNELNGRLATVPIPGAVVLFASGFAGLFGLRKKLTG